MSDFRYVNVQNFDSFGSEEVIVKRAKLLFDRLENDDTLLDFLS